MWRRWQRILPFRWRPPSKTITTSKFVPRFVQPGICEVTLNLITFSTLGRGKRRRWWWWRSRWWQVNQSSMIKKLNFFKLKSFYETSISLTSKIIRMGGSGAFVLGWEEHLSAESGEVPWKYIDEGQIFLDWWYKAERFRCLDHDTSGQGERRWGDCGSLLWLLAQGGAVHRSSAQAGGDHSLLFEIVQ